MKVKMSTKTYLLENKTYKWHMHEYVCLTVNDWKYVFAYS